MPEQKPFGPDFSLTGITLRGVGSYIDGERLDIKPLTIICGENGSGKSTWLKALNILRESHKEGLLPFRFSDAAYGYTNACFHEFEVGDDGTYASEPELDHPFGPPGTIGLEFTANRDVTVVSSNENKRVQKLKELKDSPPTILLWGKAYNLKAIYDCDTYPKGTRFSIRIAHPQFKDPTVSPSHLANFVELRINDRVMVRFAGKVDPDQKGDFRRIPTELYLSKDSTCFTSNHSGSKTGLKLAGKFLRGFEKEQPVQDCELSLKAFLRVFIEEVQGLFQELLGSYFPIGAIRELETALLVREGRKRFLNDDDENASNRRHVGSRGEFAWLMYDKYGNHRCMPTKKTNPSRMDLSSYSVADQMNECLNFLTEHQLVSNVTEYGEIPGRTVNISESVLPEAGYVGSKAATVDNSIVSLDEYNMPIALEEPNSLHLRKDPTLARVLHPCFGAKEEFKFTLRGDNGKLPSYFSAGFHQVFPVVMQSILARPGELISIENPEVHLHPGLIRRLVKYLISIADSYRTIIVETHSDLFVRRTIRALLEETIRQSKVAVCFVKLDDKVIEVISNPDLPGEFKYSKEYSLKNDPEFRAFANRWLKRMGDKRNEDQLFGLIRRKFKFSQSRIEKIQFDQHNRIINWPKGFLDEEDDEADRILEAMSRFPLNDDEDRVSDEEMMPEKDNPEDDDTGLPSDE